MATNKTCLGALVNNLTVSCGIPQHGIAQMVIADYADITSWAVDANNANVSSISFNQGAVMSLVETYKLSAQATEALRTLDAGAALAQTVSFTIYSKGLYGATVSALTNRRILIVAMYKETGLYKVFGLKCGLEMVSADSDSNADGGYFKLSFSTPEGALGESSYTISKSVYDAFLAKINV